MPLIRVEHNKPKRGTLNKERLTNKIEYIYVKYSTTVEQQTYANIPMHNYIMAMYFKLLGS